MNLQFKEERRNIEEKTDGNFISKEYFSVCDEFLSTLNLKLTQNLIEIIDTPDALEIIVNLKCEMQFEMHSHIGLGRRMPELTNLTKEGAQSL